MGLEHEFFLVSNPVDYQQLMGLGKNKPDILDSIAIQDALIQYIADSLKWIPSKNPAKSMTKEEKGLNYYGITLFDQSSSEVMKRVFNSWHSLFTNSPDKLVLTGDFEISSNIKILGEYERLVFSKDDVLETLEKMISIAERLEEGGFYLYHLGI